MRLGLVPPIVHRNPRFSPPAWEAEAGIEDLVDVALASESLGYDFICVPGHVAIPDARSDVRGPAYWDQVTTMSFLAARTSRIKLCAYVVVLGYWHPLQICKTFGTLDRVSNGRLILGAGVGSLREEFELLGVPFADRGARADDALRAVRASWGRRAPSYHGTFFDYEGFIVEPCAPSEHVPVWIGGRSRVSLQRALDLGDGWAPFKVSPSDVASLRAGIELPDGFEMILPPDPPLDPLSDPGRASSVLSSFAEAGATGLALRFVHTSKKHYLEQIEAFARLSDSSG